MLSVSVSVRHRCHPTKSPLFPIYTGLQALCWPSTTLDQAIPTYTDQVPASIVIYWPSTIIIHSSFILKSQIWNSHPCKIVFQKWECVFVCVVGWLVCNIFCNFSLVPTFKYWWQRWPQDSSWWCYCAAVRVKLVLKGVTVTVQAQPWETRR